MKASFVSIRANLIPMQLRGPQPNGMWARDGRFAFSSAVNLSVQYMQRNKYVYACVHEMGDFHFSDI